MGMSKWLSLLHFVIQTQWQLFIFFVPFYYFFFFFFILTKKYQPRIPRLVIHLMWFNHLMAWGSKYRNIWSGEVPSREFLLRNNPNNRARAPLLFSVFSYQKEKREKVNRVWMARHTLAVVVCSRSLEILVFLYLFKQQHGLPPALWAKILARPVHLCDEIPYNRSSAFLFCFFQNLFTT